MKKKILIVYSADISVNTSGGIQRYIFEFIKQRQDLDIDILSIANGNLPSNLKARNIFVIKTLIKPVIISFIFQIYLYYVLGKLNKVCSTKYDAILLNRHEEALILPILNSKKNILIVHGSIKYFFYYTFFIIASLNSLLERIIVKFFIDEIYVLLNNKTYGMPYYKIRHAFIAENIFFAPVPISEHFINHKKHIKINRDHLKLLYFGRINNNPKNVLLLPEIVQTFLICGKDVVMTIIGDGRDLNKLKNKVRVLQLENRFKFLGNIDNEKLPEIVSNHDLSFVLSNFEGICISALESLALGVPVAAFPVGDIPDYIRDMENGVLLNPDSKIKDNVEKIIRFIDIYEYRKEFITYLEKYFPENCFSNIKI